MRCINTGLKRFNKWNTFKTNLKNKEGEIIAIASGITQPNNKLKGSGYTIDSVIINENQNINHSYNIILKKEIIH